MKISHENETLYEQYTGLQYNRDLFTRTITSLLRLSNGFSPFARDDVKYPTNIPMCVINYTNPEPVYGTHIYQYDLRAAYLRAMMDGPSIITCQVSYENASHYHVECCHGKRLIKKENYDSTHESILGQHSITTKKLFARWATQYMALYQFATATENEEMRKVVRDMYRIGIGMIESQKPDYRRFHFPFIAQSIRVHLSNMIHARVTPAVLSAYTDSISLPFEDDHKAPTWWRVEVKESVNA